jgi:hypothetical protein
MNESTLNIRLMEADDFDAVVGIDEKVLKTSRTGQNRGGSCYFSNAVLSSPAPK